MLDADGDGMISQEELMAALSEPLMMMEQQASMIMNAPDDELPPQAVAVVKYLKKVQDVAAAARRGETIGQSTNMGQLGSGLGGGCSLYVSELAEALGQMPSIEDALAPEVRSVVLSMFAEATVQLYLEMILGCRKMNPQTVELLLNDAATVQVMLMEMMDEVFPHPT